MNDLQQIKKELKGNIEGGMGQISAVSQDLSIVKSRLSWEQGTAYIQYTLTAKLITPFDEEYDEMDEAFLEAKESK